MFIDRIEKWTMDVVSQKRRITKWSVDWWPTCVSNPLLPHFPTNISRIRTNVDWNRDQCGEVHRVKVFKTGLVLKLQSDFLSTCSNLLLVSIVKNRGWRMRKNVVGTIHNKSKMLILFIYISSCQIREYCFSEVFVVEFILTSNTDKVYQQCPRREWVLCAWS